MEEHRVAPSCWRLGHGLVLCPGKEEQQQQQKKKEEKQQQEGAAEGQQEVGESQNIFQSPLRLVRKAKMKLVVCHVTLLDGTDFSCEVEVRQRDQSVILKLLIAVLPNKLGCKFLGGFLK